MYWARHLVKILKAVEILARPGGATIDDLQEKLDVDRRTVYRLMTTLNELQFPLDEDCSRLDGKKHFRFMDSYLARLKRLPNLTVPDLNLSLTEVIALYFIRGNTRMFKGTDIEKCIDAAFAKLDAFMPERLSEQVAKVKTLFVATGRCTKDYTNKQEIIDSLTDAIFQQRTCDILYNSFSSDKEKRFSIDPLHFFERDGGLYLFVRATKYGHIRSLAVERIMSLETTTATFAAPEDFDPETLLEGAFGVVYDEPVELKIAFTRETARYVKERHWAQGQTITDLSDGSIILEMKTSGRFEIKRWILSFGGQAEVLQPQEMRDEVKLELQMAVERYL